MRKLVLFLGFLGFLLAATCGRRSADRGLDEPAALARVIRSEVGDGTPAERAAIGWAARNRAAHRHVSVVRLVCTPRCGPQHEANATLRPMSSGQPPLPRDVRLAEEILASPRFRDPTGGADSFIEPALQDDLVRHGRLGYHVTYRTWRRRWLREGQHVIGRVGRFELWRVG